MGQNILAETELRLLASTTSQIVSPSSNVPIISIYQDSLLGSYRFSREGIKFSPRDAMNLLMAYPNVNPATLFERSKKEVSNFEILSQIMPPLTLKYKTKLWDADKKEDPATSNNYLEIYNGRYIRGQIEKSVLGGGSKGILHRICNDYGKKAGADFIDNLQNIVTEYMKVSSYSVGVSDLMSNRETYTRIIQAIQDKELEVSALIQKLHAGVFENNTSFSNKTEFEAQVNNVLNDATKKTDEISRQSLNPDNRFLMIVNSGSKGSLLNISHMISCLGQVNVDSKRVPYGFDSRTLPHFCKFDDSPGARGFIKNSYIGGLNAHELFFHAMGGRIGLIDTAVKTSQTGYIQRRLIKGLEDLKVEYDLTVRNSNGKVIQFSYGEDAFDPMFVENQSLPIVTMSTQDIYMHYDMVTTDKTDGDVKSVFNKSASARMGKQKAELQKTCKKYVDMMMDARDMAVKNIFKNKNVDSVLAPVGFMHIINNIQGNLGLAANSIVDITPLEAFQLIEEYFAKLNSLHYAKPNPLFETLYFYYLNPRELLLIKRFHRKGLILLLETVFLKYKQALVNPGEMVGVVAGQSIGEPTTQLTLNSFVYETEILVRDDKGVVTSFQIGDFAKWGIETTGKMEYMADKDTTYAELSKFYEVPSATEDGQTVWRRIEAVTKHPVINEDGTNTMLKVTTKGNREIIATKAKSFLQLIDGKIQGVNGSELKVGDYLPVSKKAIEFTERFAFDLREVLPPSEYIYGTEMEKARSVVDEHHWWSKHTGKTFTIPYTRSDSAYAVLKETKTRPNHIVYKPGCVYTMTNNICNYEVPEFIPLDYEFGYLIGAYCAEGCMTKHQVSIANNDLEYLKPIESWCQRYNLTTKIYCHKDKIQEGWTSQDIRIYSTLLCRVLEKMCGKLSHNKFISDIITFSNRQCLLGFLDAYISGDGSVTKRIDRIAGISMASVSLKMLSQVQLILKNLGVVGKIYKPTKVETNNRGSKDIKQIYSLIVANNQSIRLGRMLNLSIKSKQDRIQTLLQQPSADIEYCKSDLHIPNMIAGELVMELRAGRCPDLEFDKIISIEEVPNTTDYAYDLTVEDTRNFDCRNGLALVDTFHTAGVASKSNVTRGVPRIEEILRLTKNPKHPSMTVFLKSADEGNQEKAKQFANMMEHTKLGDVITSVQICFDPDEFNTRIMEDRKLVQQYYEFSRMLEDCNEAPLTDQTTKSKWIVRMEMDTETLLDKNITMDDIHFTIKNGTAGNDVECAYADYNSDKLVFRIRMSNIASGKKRKGGAEPLDQTDEIHILKKFQDDLLNNTVLRGVGGIANVLPRKLNNMVAKVDGKYEKRETWVLDTTGSNLLETLGLDYIDSVRTHSNDIREMFDVLGIEAARQIIHDEIVDVLEFSGAYANYHHLSLLCDRMTTKKGLVSIFRTGLFSDDIGPIAKATFEVHTEVLLDAARFGEADNMRGVSSNVMCGQPGYYGTNAFQLVLDMNEMSKLAATQVTEQIDPMAELMGKTMEDSDVCPRSKMEIRNNIGNMKHSDPGLCDDNYNAGF